MSIGLIGHSEGGMIAPMVASRNPNVDFIVLLAAPGIPISEMMVRQNSDIMIAGKVPKEIIELEIKGLKEIYAVLKNNKLDVNKKLEKVISIKEKTYQKYPDGFINKDDIEKMSETGAKIYLSPWMHYFGNMNPQEYLRKITIPVLALNGAKDIQVSATENLEGIEKSLKKAGNKNYKIVNLPDLNHLFQKCFFGTSDYYPKNKETFNEGAMRVIAEWVNRISD
jgi:pimeloyl-ACP methyl ester carboxylesterase